MSFSSARETRATTPLRPWRAGLGGVGDHFLKRFHRSFHDRFRSRHFDEDAALRTFQDCAAEPVTGHRRRRPPWHTAAEGSFRHGESDLHRTNLNVFGDLLRLAAWELRIP